MSPVKATTRKKTASAVKVPSAALTKERLGALRDEFAACPQYGQVTSEDLKKVPQ